MAKCVLKDGTIVQDYGQPYFVAEVNTSHYGKIEIAKQLIDAAVESGCDCVKFQSWSASTLYSQTYYEQNPFAKRMVSRFAFDAAVLKELSQYCLKGGIAFSSTPYSRQEVDFLVDECNAPFIKIASMDLDNDKFLEYIANKHIPIVLSTGMSTIEEIDHAINLLADLHVDNLCILHCISVYPPKGKDIRLKNIEGLRKKYPEYPIGFSDHSLGDEMSIAATALGACLVEKHLTMDRSKIGMDNQMAIEPMEMRELIRRCKLVSEALGSESRVLSDDEIVQKKKMRRSIVALCDIKKGMVIQEDMLCAKRPASGFPLCMWNNVVGKKARRDIIADTVIYQEDIE